MCPLVRNGFVIAESHCAPRGRVLQALELVERAVESSFEVGRLEGKAVETPGSGGVGSKDGGEALLGPQAAVLLLPKRREREQILDELANGGLGSRGFRAGALAQIAAIGIELILEITGPAPGSATDCTGVFIVSGSVQLPRCEVGQLIDSAGN